MVFGSYMCLLRSVDGPWCVKRGYVDAMWVNFSQFQSFSVVLTAQRGQAGHLTGPGRCLAMHGQSSAGLGGKCGHALVSWHHYFTIFLSNMCVLCVCVGCVCKVAPTPPSRCPTAIA